MSIYSFRVKDMSGNDIEMETFQGKVVIIVNTASKCGFTPQFKELEDLYKEYKDRGLVVLGFPCNQFMNQDPGSDSEILSFCEINYGVTFPMLSKVNVLGDDAHPLFKFLQKEKKGLLGETIKWNFTKFLIDRQGNVIQRYSPQTSPIKMKSDIEALL